MRKGVLIPLLLAILGIIFLAGGASAYIARSAKTVVCEACGMEIEKDDPSTFSIVSSDQTVHYGCCPICAQIVGIYYNNSQVSAECFACGRNIALTINDDNLTSISPTGSTYNVSVILGGMCMKNKIVCSNACAESVRNMYDWAANLPVKTSAQAFSISQSKYAEFTVSYRPISVPALTYALLGSGIVLLALAPASWVFMRKQQYTEPAEKKADK